MENYHMNAKFFPAAEPRNGFIGSVNLTIAHAIRLNRISVFENKDGPGHHIQFPGYEAGDQQISYVVPASKEAHARMLDVIEKAVQSEKDHFAWVSGRMNPYLTVSGRAVDEPYADGRYSVNVADVCTLYGISTREVTYEKENGDGHFIAVDLPTMSPYEKDGQAVYPPVFEGLKDEYEKDGVKKSKDFNLLIRNLVLNEREALLEKDHPPLDAMINEAQQKASSAPPPKEPAKEAEPAI